MDSIVDYVTVLSRKITDTRMESELNYVPDITINRYFRRIRKYTMPYLDIGAQEMEEIFVIQLCLLQKIDCSMVVSKGNAHIVSFISFLLILKWTTDHSIDLEYLSVVGGFRTSDICKWEVEILDIVDWIIPLHFPSENALS